jgi:hypothetical protein
MNTAGRARAGDAEAATGRQDFSPDGKRLLVMKYVSINEIHPGVVDLASGKLAMFPVDGGKAALRRFRCSRRMARQVYFISDEPETEEFLTLRHHDPASGAPSVLSADIPWDVKASHRR